MHLTVTPRKSINKALLIGIRYLDGTLPGAEKYPTLGTPHEDVSKIRGLLIKRCGYSEKNIVVMTDSKDALPKYRPTRDHIIKELHNLVKDARAGDRLFLHYSGHSDQQKSTDGLEREPDGMDECLVSCDLQLIVDNELRKIVVDNVPVGCSFVGAFDSCHAATILDLEHHQCNVPKKERRPDDPRKPKPIRRCATMKSISSFMSDGGRGRKRQRSKTIRRTRMTVPGENTVSLSQVTSNTTTTEGSWWLSRWLETKKTSEVEDSSWSLDADLVDSSSRQASPDRYRSHCTGDCPSSPTLRPANVISIAPCGDDQVIYESRKGGFLTNALVDMLDRDEVPTLEDVMRGIYKRLQSMKKGVERDMKRVSSKNPDQYADLPQPGFEMPWFGSMRKLDMQAYFVI